MINIGDRVKVVSLDNSNIYPEHPISIGAVGEIVGNESSSRNNLDIIFKDGILDINSDDVEVVGEDTDLTFAHTYLVSNYLEKTRPKIVATKRQIPVYTGGDEKLFNDIKFVISQINSLRHQYDELWRNNNQTSDLMSSIAYEHSCRLLSLVLDQYVKIEKEVEDGGV